MPSAPDGANPADALTPAELDELFTPFSNFSNLALAVSGGADSICLLFVFNRWRLRSGWPGRCEVLTVDHGLRPESAVEAQSVRDLCGRYGIPCTLLRWLEDKPKTGIQDAARTARYQLFKDHVRKSGAEALLLAHHQDDQAETFLDRLTRGSGVTGLSGMAPDERKGPFGLRLLRPFLEVPKSRLVATLQIEGLTWHEDPSNLDPKYKRSRLRRILELLSEEGLTADRISETARQLRRARTALDSVVTHIFLTEVEEHPAGPLRVPLTSVLALEEELRLRLMVLMINRVSGSHYAPRLRQIELLDQWLRSGKSGRTTLGGALFEAAGESLYVWKEAGRTSPSVIQDPAATGCWDGRFDYAVPPDLQVDPSAAVYLGPYCEAPVACRGSALPADWPRDAFAASPVIWCASGSDDQQAILLLSSTNEGATGTDLSLKLRPFRRLSAGNHINEQIDP